MTTSPGNRVIGIDGSRATVGQPTGTERYAIELLGSLEQLDPEDPIRVYFNQSNAKGFPPHPGEAVQIRAARFWTLRSLALEMRRNPPDLLFVPSHVIPPVHPRSVVTVHDLGYLEEPECHDPMHRKQLDWSTRWNCGAAAGIIAVSDHTRVDLIERLNVPSERIRVIHHGVRSRFKPGSKTERQALRATLDLPDVFILAVGTIQPRKNLIRLIQSFEYLAAQDRDIGLVLCGRTGWRGDQILDRVKRSPYAHRIRHVGFLDDDLLPAMYSEARATAFVSLYEGFGLPALESMACGTPVVAANRSSLPEICGEAAILVDPTEVPEIVAALDAALYNDAQRQRMVERGFQQAQSFTWQNCATETLAFLRAVRDNLDRATTRSQDRTR